jgi:hypothetical protein
MKSYSDESNVEVELGGAGLFFVVDGHVIYGWMDHWGCYSVTGEIR